MRKHEDSACFMVAPHPDLKKRMKEELVKLRENASELLVNKLRIIEKKPIGMDDGLILPGTYFPVGTPARVVQNAAASRAPLRGSVRVIVVLVDFPDKKMVQTQKHFQDLFFSLNTLPNGSVREYYREASNSLIDIIGEVFGPYTLPKKLSEYAHGASGTGSTSPNAKTMAKDAATAANADVNFAPYDNDGNGFVDAFIVVHAGSGAEETGSVNDIWSHKWLLEGGAYNADGTKIYAYLTVPEDAKTGVCCHELGHLLFGFPDLYDTDQSSEGVGSWCLMGSGNWNGGGDVPGHLSPWCKANQGWVTVVNQMDNASVSITDVKTNHIVYRLSKDGAPGSEYFLVENRQKALFDRYLPGGGLLIWHVDESIPGNDDENHYKVALEQADNKRDLEQAHNRGDAADPFPGTSNNTAFGTMTSPNSKSYAGAETCISVTNISPAGSVMTADITVKCKSKEKDKDVKDLKDVKDIRDDGKQLKKEKKEILKEKKEIVKEKREMKEWKEKYEHKEKLEHKEKNEYEKPFERPDDPLGWPKESADYEGRIHALESRLAAIEPFIDRSLRPDLTDSALGCETDLAEARSQLELRAAEAKREYDTKPREY